MNLPDVKALKELLKLLRAQGVLQYQTQDLNLVLTETAPITTKSKAQEVMDSEDDEEALTPEEQMERTLFYSADKTTES